MRRKQGQLVPLEVSILGAAADLRFQDVPDFHGFSMAKLLSAGSSRLTAQGTLYKALGRLETMGLLDSRWEEADIALDAGRPRRRLYSITADGQRALAGAAASARPPALRPGIATA